MNKSSIDIHGEMSGGGVCMNCQHNTAGNNCQQCRDGFYRSFNVPLDSPHVCRRTKNFLHHFVYAIQVCKHGQIVIAIWLLLFDMKCRRGRIKSATSPQINLCCHTTIHNLCPTVTNVNNNNYYNYNYNYNLAFIASVSKILDRYSGDIHILYSVSLRSHDAYHIMSYHIVDIKRQNRLKVISEQEIL